VFSAANSYAIDVILHCCNYTAIVLVVFVVVKDKSYRPKVYYNFPSYPDFRKPFLELLLKTNRRYICFGSWTWLSTFPTNVLPQSRVYFCTAS